jgi:hypothetical protein
MVISLIGQMWEGAMNAVTDAERKAAEKKAAEDKRKIEGPFSIEEVLAKEAQDIRGTDKKLADELLKGLVAAQAATAKAAADKAAAAKAAAAKAAAAKAAAAKAAAAKDATAKDAAAKDATAKDAAAKDAAAKDAAAKDAAAKDANNLMVLRYRMDGDQRTGDDILANEVEARKAFYRALNVLNRAALCCSGGGIRSATFCLGVIQALAAYDVSALRPAPTNIGASPKPDEMPTEMKAEDCLLGCFQYLSTVSGGGYVGSWLSSWLKRNEFHQVIENLTGRPSGPDVEPAEISWLRAYSNYLTPRLGITSADAWAAVAIFVRNLLLNWLIIIPVVCGAVLSLKLVATFSVWLAHNVADPQAMMAYATAPMGIVDIVRDPLTMIAIAVIGAICLIFAQGFTNRHRPTRRADAENVNVEERAFLWHDLIWAALSAIFFTIFFSSQYFISGFKGWTESIAQKFHLAPILNYLGVDPKLKFLLLTAIAGLLIYSVGWIAGRRFSKGGWDFLAWAASGLVYGALVGLGAYLFSLLEPYPVDPGKIRVLLLSMIFGVPWILTSQLAAENIFIGLVSYEGDSDSDREWLGRAAGWLAAGAIAWALTAFLVFAGEYAVRVAYVISIKALLAAGGITGIATALLGMSSSSPATATSDDKGSKKAILTNIALAVAGPIFAVALIVGLSIALDQLLLGNSLVRLLQIPTLMSTRAIMSWLALGLVIAVAVSLLASYFVNINRFSLHALYRNRLIRGYLGASRQERNPDRFTGFDSKDNISVYELWPPKSTQGAGAQCLFHVVNIALNVVSTKRLAWQERKAESFIVTPRHCGSAYLGFRLSNVYGEPKGKGGISLGTAVAISGAAASPNMGYHSSPSVTLLLALFNVRLGWWLGNPGKAGDDSYPTDGPKWAAAPLFMESFGQTTDASPYVYLSDGGHFENLALYEMVRRRCRFIVVIDAGCDPKFTFEDLGNAVRKIYIDLGIQIQFQSLRKLCAHPSDDGADKVPYYAIGTIDYKEADGDEKGDNGHILYIKPAYHGTEGVGIRSYATNNRDFPHESTADQWFTESQFESYRSLGREIGDQVLGESDVKEILKSYFKG